ncbi:MAG: cobalamin biosynthesis protein P47K [Acidimicrobiia bacterium]|nr:cobalamin biosynthesis protein P47K [Acidimicrobiia bacterium]
MVGGFLGAGKTTAMLRLAEHLSARGVRVGLVTNDQSSGLADTTLLASSGFPVEEITGGCFCCRFGSLMDAADRLTASMRPDVFLAEPVGSCTDLKATVSYPLRRMYGENFVVAPFSVLVDPLRALRVLDLEPGRRFTDKVRYVYEKQLEEADLLVINKIDAVEAERLAILRAALAERYPSGTILDVSARTGAGLDAWFARVLESEDAGDRDLPIDYDDYATGEARLGWLNLTARVTGAAFDGNAWVSGLIGAMQQRLRARDLEIAHLKMTLAPLGGDRDLCVANATGTDAEPGVAFRLGDPLEAGELVVNLRAEGDPDVLRAETRAALDRAAAAHGLTASIEHIEHFRPGRPVPTHRLVMA